MMVEWHVHLACQLPEELLVREAVVRLDFLGSDVIIQLHILDKGWKKEEGLNSREVQIFLASKKESIISEI